MTLSLDILFNVKALHHCDGIQLQSLSNEGLLVSSSVRIAVMQYWNRYILFDPFLSQGEVQLEEVYRGMMITAAHLHLMIRDAYDSARFCPTENHAQHQNIRQ